LHKLVHRLKHKIHKVQFTARASMESFIKQIANLACSVISKRDRAHRMNSPVCQALPAIK